MKRSSNYTCTNPNRRFLIAWIALATFMAVLFTVGAGAVGTYPAVDPSMVLYYHMNNNSAIGENDTFVVDSSNASNNGTVYGSAVWNSTGGYLGDGAFEFNGYSNYITSTDQGLNITAEITIAGWVNPNNCATTNSIISKSDAGVGGYHVYLGSTCNFGINLYGLTDNFFTGGTSIPKNRWTSFIFTYNGSMMSLYINGRLNTSDDSSGVIGTNNNLLTIGRRSYTAGSTYFNGSIDEIIVYNESLDRGEAWSLYHKYYGCFNAPNDYDYIPYNTTFCGGSYYKNGTTDGVFEVASDVTLDFNYSSFYGNNSIYFLLGYECNNIQLLNSKLYNYSYGLYFPKCSNVTVRNNYIESTASGIRGYSVRDALIFNNTINGLIEFGGVRAGIYFSNDSYNINVTGNNVSNHYGGIGLENANNSVVYHNLFNKNIGHSIFLSYFGSQTSNYNVIDSNIIYNGGQATSFNGIRVNGNYNNITNNVIYNQTHVGIDLFSCEASGMSSTNYNRVINNTIANHVEGGHIQLCNASYNYLENNRVLNYTGNASSRHRVFIRDSSHYNTFVDLHLDTSAVIDGDYVAIFDSENNTFRNLSINITGIVRYAYRQNNSAVFTGLLIDGENYVTMDVNVTANASIYYLANALVYIDNLSIYGGANIANNDGNINITLPPGNSSYVLNDYNKSEWASRQFDPIWFSEIDNNANGKKVKIASNISNITNVPVYLNVDCDRIGTVYYTPEGGTKAKVPYTCSDGVAAFTVDINTATGSNEFDILYDKVMQDVCEGSSFAGVKIFSGIGMLATILILGATFLFLYSRYGEGFDTMSMVVGLAIVGLIALMFLVLFIQNIVEAGC